MKQFLLAGVALLAALTTQAQTNTSVISQTGNMQSATAVQAGSYNDSQIRQATGTSTTVNVGNVASTSQTGSGTSLTNRAIIDQINGAFNNNAKVKQTFSGTSGPNIGVVVQSENATLNMASITQEKSGNAGTVVQTDRSNNNEATIMQLGTTGTAQVLQASQSGYNQATLTQAATSNSGSFGTIAQSTQSYYDRAIIEQAGTTDGALISQSGQSANNDALIKQGVGGINNLAAITQTNAYAGASAGASTALGAANSATITQNQTTVGTENFANIQQGTFDPSPAGPVVSTGNKASVAQERDMNTTDLLQVGTGNKAGIVQNGYSTLKGLGMNTTAGQFGNTNTLTVMQTGSMANPNIGNVTQIGTGNVGTIMQVVPTP